MVEGHSESKQPQAKENIGHLNRKKIVTFVLIAYGISWLIWLPKVLDYNFDLGWNVSNWNHIAGGLGPFFQRLLPLIYSSGKRG